MLQLEGLEPQVSARVYAAVQNIASTEFEDIHRGFEQLASITKRSDDVLEGLEALLRSGLVQTILTFISAEPVRKYPQLVPIAVGYGQDDVMVPAGEALQLAACAALGEAYVGRMWGADVPRLAPRLHGLHYMACCG